MDSSDRERPSATAHSSSVRCTQGFRSRSIAGSFGTIAWDVGASLDLDGGALERVRGPDLFIQRAGRRARGSVLDVSDRQCRGQEWTTWEGLGRRLAGLGLAIVVPKADRPARGSRSTAATTRRRPHRPRRYSRLVFEGPRDRRRRRLRSPLKSALHVVDRPLWTFTRRRYQPFDGVELLVSRTRSHEADVIDTGEPRLDAAYTDWFDQSEEHEYFFRTTGPALIDPRHGFAFIGPDDGSCSTR